MCGDGACRASSRRAVSRANGVALTACETAGCVRYRHAIPPPWHTRCPIRTRHAAALHGGGRISHTRQGASWDDAQKETGTMNQVIKFLKAEDGQDLIEYALLAALIALAAVVAMQATGTSINGVFNSIAGRLNSSVSGS